MACFIVPGAEAVVSSIVTKVIESKERRQEQDNHDVENTSCETKVPFSKKLKWLNSMLWGGSALLAFEHLWHGEIQPWFPFLTAASNPSDAMEMLHEMATTGSAMSLAVTLIWVGMVAVSNAIAKKPVDIELVTDKKAE